MHDMQQSIMVSLANNTALLLVLSVVFELTYHMPAKYHRLKAVVSGLMITLICIVIMNVPFMLQPGVFYDTRSILISVTALVFGLVPTAITAVAAFLYRLSIGGEGTWQGLAVIISSALIGLAWRRWILPKSKKPRWLSIFLMSLVVHIVMLACTFLIPYPDSVVVFRAIALPVMIIYPIGSVLLSMLLMQQQQYKNVLSQLKQSEERFRCLFDQAPLGYQSLDFDGNFLEVNQQWLDTLGYTRDEVIGRWFGDFLLPGYRDAFRERFPIFKQEGQIHSEFELLHKNGKPVYIAFEGRIGYAQDGTFKQTHCILQDITRQKQSEEELRASEEKYSMYIESAPNAVCVVNENGQYIEVNKAAADITGYDRETLLTMSIADLTNEDTRETALHGFENLKTTGKLCEDLTFVHKDGSVRWWTVDAVKISDHRYIGFSCDITEEKNAEENLRHLSYHDSLTGLYNRRYFEEALKDIDTPKSYPLSIFMGDINGVKLVNDAFGHAEGDKLIIACANIIQSCCRSEDIIARIGGDEFCILMPNTDTTTAPIILDRIEKALVASNDLSHDKYTHSVSLGFATKRVADEDISQILKIAEEYMYQRKLLEHTSSHSAIISSIKATMLEKNQETEEHAERLGNLAKAIAMKLKLPQIEQDRLELLATLHDIGKVGIRDQILTKPGKLSADEWVEMKRHPEIGYRIAISSPDLIPIAESILCHHEHWDGSGYPQGLHAENIPLLSRIIAVVDAYDAMTQDRPYRKAMPNADAIAEIELNAGKQFDPRIVKVFTELVKISG
jgi:diguanylate cyclase